MKLMIVPVLLLLGCDSHTEEPPLPDAAPIEVIMKMQILGPGQSVDGVFTGDGSAKIHLNADVPEIDWNIDDGNGGPKVHDYVDQRSVEFPFVMRGTSAHLHVTNSGASSITVQTRIELYALPGNAPAFAWK